MVEKLATGALGTTKLSVPRPGLQHATREAPTRIRQDVFTLFPCIGPIPRSRTAEQSVNSWSRVMPLG